MSESILDSQQIRDCLPFEEIRFNLDNHGFDKHVLQNRAKNLLSSLTCTECERPAQFSNFKEDTFKDKILCSNHHGSQENNEKFEELEPGLNSFLDRIEKFIIYNEVSFIVEIKISHLLKT